MYVCVSAPKTDDIFDWFSMLENDLSSSEFSFEQ
jgi:hypothetical protein